MCFGIPTFDAGVKQQMFTIITHIYSFCHHIYIYVCVCVHILRRYDIYIITHKNRFLADACWRQGSCSNSKSDVFLRLATPPLLLMHFPVLAMASLSIPWSPKLVRVGSGIWFSATNLDSRFIFNDTQFYGIWFSALGNGNLYQFTWVYFFTSERRPWKIR